MGRARHWGNTMPQEARPPQRERQISSLNQGGVVFGNWHETHTSLGAETSGTFHSCKAKYTAMSAPLNHPCNPAITALGVEAPGRGWRI
jgi:hypothetical protein